MPYQIETRKVTAQDVMSIRVQCHVAELGAMLGEILPEMRKGFAEGRPAHIPEAPTSDTKGTTSRRYRAGDA